MWRIITRSSTHRSAVVTCLVVLIRFYRIRLLKCTLKLSLEMVADNEKGSGGDTQGRTSQPEGEISLISLKILPLLKERQQQHGLRHGDYQRYHGYCSRRLRRLRETLRIPQGDKRHFKKKEITVTEIDSEKSDSRHLEIPLTVTERAWACAMELKQDANTETRKKFHMISRLKKAFMYAETLVKLSEESVRIDARTKLECEAYASFITAAYHFEREQWDKAMTAYKKTQSIYTQISQALGDHPEAAVYSEKTAEILPAMRFCSYKSGAELKIYDLASEYQSAAIEAMIAQRPKMSEITFRNNKISVPNEKIAALLVRVEEFEKKKTDKKVDMYEQILIELRDVIQHVRDNSKLVEQPGVKAKPSMLLSYLLYLRQKLTNSRTELMMQEKTSPKDCIRFVEMIIHNFGEMKTISGLDTDEDFQLEVEDQTNVFRGVRCRYIGDVYKFNKRWGEAAVVYERSEEYFQRALKSLPSDSPYIGLIKNTRSIIEGSSVECRAQAILSRANEERRGEGDSSFKLSRPKEPLIDRLDEFILDESLVSGEPNVAPFPPNFRPIPCKPLFFDLAGNHIELPLKEIEEQAGVSKKSPKKEAGGITGLVKGLWGWGSK